MPTSPIIQTRVIDTPDEIQHIETKRFLISFNKGTWSRAQLFDITLSSVLCDDFFCDNLFLHIFFYDLL